MCNSLKLLMRNQKGQALPIVLGLLAIGGLTIAVTLNYATTNLKGTQVDEENMKGIYAANAGVENSLWSILQGNSSPPASIPDINGMHVNINTVVGTNNMTLYIDDLQTGVHGEMVTVGNNITSLGGNLYEYTITMTTNNNTKSNTSLDEFGAVLPNGYTFETNSTIGFRGSNLSYVPQTGGVPNPQLDDPNYIGFLGGGAQWVKWYWPQHPPGIGPSENYTESFKMTGTGSTGGSYAWAHGGSMDIGSVGQITGYLTTINATATRPSDGKITGRVTANSIIGSGGLYILSWQISK
jgi:hypothetical protein